MAKRDNWDQDGWGGSDSPDDQYTWRDTESVDTEGVEIPDVVKEVYADENRTTFLAAAGMMAVILAGYGVKRVIKKRKS